MTFFDDRLNWNMSKIGSVAISFEDLRLGQSAAFEVVLASTDIDGFSQLTGDANPLHMDEHFAAQRGFKGRVVHGMLLSGLVSRLIGMHLPGRNCLLHSMQMKYHFPAYVGDRLRISGVVEQISDVTRAAVLRIAIQNVTAAVLLASGKVTVGFTQER